MNEIREQDIRALVERIVGLGVDAAAGCEKNGWMEVPTEISARHEIGRASCRERV